MNNPGSFTRMLPATILLCACGIAGAFLWQQRQDIAGMRRQLAARENTGGSPESVAFWKNQAKAQKEALEKQSAVRMAVPVVPPVEAEPAARPAAPSRAETVVRPEFQSLLVESLVPETRRRFQPLLARLGLPASAEKTLVDLLSRHSLAAADAADFPDGKISPGIVAECEGQVRMLLGEDRFKEYLRFNAERPHREMVEEAQLVLASRGRAISASALPQLTQYLGTLAAPGPIAPGQRPPADFSGFDFLDAHQREVLARVVAHRRAVAYLNSRMPVMSAYGPPPEK